MILDTKVDSASSKWDDIIGDEKDTNDIKTLREEHGSMDVSSKTEFLPGSGLILRQGNQPRGYVLFEVSSPEDDTEGERSLLIQHFYTSETVRGAGSFIRIIELFREQAEKRNCTSIKLRPITPMEMHLTKRIGARKQGNYFVIPVKELDIRTILSRL
jgi:hypothetical protein